MTAVLLWLSQHWREREPVSPSPTCHPVALLRPIRAHFENHWAHWSLRSLPAARICDFKACNDHLRRVGKKEKVKLRKG